MSTYQLNLKKYLKIYITSEMVHKNKDSHVLKDGIRTNLKAFRMVYLAQSLLLTSCQTLMFLNSVQTSSKTMVF